MESVCPALQLPFAHIMLRQPVASFKRPEASNAPYTLTFARDAAQINHAFIKALKCTKHWHSCPSTPLYKQKKLVHLLQPPPETAAGNCVRVSPLTPTRPPILLHDYKIVTSRKKARP
eukprot:1152374-Pelagomonas_calceolata.AAC.7